MAPKKITSQELPKLIAASVERALAKHPATEAQLAALAHGPIRIGILPVNVPVGGKLPPSIGFILRELDEIENPAAIEVIRE